MKRRTFFSVALVMALLLLLAVSLGQAQESSIADTQTVAEESDIGAAFTYQGQLFFEETPVNEICVFRFTLWDEVGSGEPPAGGNMLTDPVTVEDVEVIDGLFTVSLDFQEPVFTGEARWLEITLDCGGINDTLSPRQPLTPAPYALHAADAGLLDARQGDYYLTLGGLACGNGQFPAWDVGHGTWECASETDPQVGSLVSGMWCRSNGAQVVCDQSPPLQSEVDPQVGILVAESGCRSDGSQVICDQSPPLQSEVDPQVDILVAERGCRSDGSQVICDQVGGAGGNVKQLIHDFVVAAGESVTAGDVVQFLDGYVQQDSVHGSEYVFNSADTDRISAAALSATQFVVTYGDESDFAFGTAVTGLVGNTVGIAGESKTGGQTVPVIIHGVSDVHSGLTSGAIYYLDALGDLTMSETGRRIGLVISDTELLLDIDVCGE